MKSFHILLIVFLVSCNRKQSSFDASGTFEAEETIISAQATGTIMQFNIEEGQVLKAAQNIGYIDSVQLYLKKKQLEAQIKSTLIQRPDISTQVGSLVAQLQAAEKEQQRFTNLVKADAAPRKQLDDITAQVNVLKKQIEAQQSSLSTTSQSISEQTSPIRVQIEQVNDQLANCRIINPINGTVLTKYMEQNEMATAGKPLYKIADLSYLILRAYITGNQLSKIKLNQTVKITGDANTAKQTDGTITWISDKAEFTPKTIQTKDERANLVYAIKIKVKSDGSFKPGMYAEVKF